MMFSSLEKKIETCDLLIIGWPCKGHSRADLYDPRSNLFWELVWIMNWWFKHQSTLFGYILESVPPYGYH